MIEFTPFPKIPRFFRDIVITEKIDGTNASVKITTYLDEDIDANKKYNQPGAHYIYDLEANTVTEILVGSRTRWLSKESDNFGFHKWVVENARNLTLLGDGHHFGEWWGRGIQRGYGLDERRFSLFNVSRTAEWEAAFAAVPGLGVVPTLYTGPIEAINGTSPIRESLRRLGYGGSLAAPGFRDPEGIIVFHEHGRHSYKVTLDGNDNHKG